MKKNHARKGFTITELIIVIVVIAILAAVLIPTFTGIIEKAHKSADLQLLRNAYTIVETEKTLNATVTKEEALAALAESGISSLELSSDDYAIYWDPANMNFALYDNEKGEVVMPKGAAKADNWVLVDGDEVPEVSQPATEATEATEESEPSEETTVPTQPQPTTYNVTKTETNATITGADSVEANATYTATVTPATDYVLTAVTVKVNGAVVENAYTGDYNGVNISVTATGNIEIVATTTKNQVRNATALGGSGVYQTNGYVNGGRISSDDGGIGNGSYAKEAAGYASTGWIPGIFTQDTVIYIQGGTLDNTSSTRLYFYKSASDNGGYYAQSNSSNIDNTFSIDSIGNGWTKLVLQDTGDYQKVLETTCMRISLLCSDGANLIITFEKPLGLN